MGMGTQIQRRSQKQIRDAHRFRDEDDSLASSENTDANGNGNFKRTENPLRLLRLMRQRLPTNDEDMLNRVDDEIYAQACDHDYDVAQVQDWKKPKSNHMFSTNRNSRPHSTILTLLIP
jgi:hypothetical protein